MNFLSVSKDIISSSSPKRARGESIYFLKWLATALESSLFMKHLADFVGLLAFKDLIEKIQFQS